MRLNYCYFKYYFKDGKQIVKQRWTLIKDCLSQKISNSREFEKAVKSYNSNIPELGALHYFFEEVGLYISTQLVNDKLKI